MALAGGAATTALSRPRASAPFPPRRALPVTASTHARPASTGNAPPATAAWPEHEYLTCAHAALDAIYEAALAAGEADAFGDDFDAETDGGVVRLHLGEAGGYVVNTQTPNRQIWLSSPVSGPWRYDWDRESGEWRATRDGHRLFELLERELKEIAGDGVEIEIREEEPV